MWAFEVTPTGLQEVYWTHTLEEIQTYSRLRLSWFQAQAFQQHQVMRIIMEQAFGSSKETAAQHEPKSKDEAKLMLAGLFKK